MVVRIDLAHEFGGQRLRRWRNGHAGDWREAHVVFGRLADGRWYADRTGRTATADDGPGGAFVFAATELGQTLALRLAYRWMGDGQRWLPTPANDPPDDGLPWRLAVSQWVLDG